MLINRRCEGGTRDNTQLLAVRGGRLDESRPRGEEVRWCWTYDRVRSDARNITYLTSKATQDQRLALDIARIYA